MLECLSLGALDALYGFKIDQLAGLKAIPVCHR